MGSQTFLFMKIRQKWNRLWEDGVYVIPIHFYIHSIIILKVDRFVREKHRFQKQPFLNLIKDTLQFQIFLS